MKKKKKNIESLSVLQSRLRRVLRIRIVRRQGVSGSKRRGGSFHRTVDCGGRGSYYRSGQVTTFINNAVAQTKNEKKR